MKRLGAVLLLLLGHQLRADISGYTLTRPALDAEIHPRLVAAAQNGNVWFSQQTTIGFFTPSGHVTTFAIPCTKCATGEETIFVWDLEAAADGSVWFIDNHAKANGVSIDSAIGHLTTSGAFTFFAIPTSGGTAVVQNGFGHSFLTLAPDGSVWFTENAAARAAKLAPSTGAFTEYPLEMPEQPSGITIDAGGKVWFSVADHEIAQIVPPLPGFVEFGLSSGAFPFGLTTGSDGNIWFAEAGRSKIGRFKPSGLVTEFELPVSDGVPQHIATSPDGTLWYTESIGMDVGRININGPTPSFESVVTPGLQNFDVTIAPSSHGPIIYVTGRDVATGKDTLSAFMPVIPETRKRAVKH